MQAITNILVEHPLLRLYGPRLPVSIPADSSSKGLGACLLQNKQPVAYASRSLTETRYAQIEKELLAIVFATDKFHHYIYGQEVDVQSDHKPLENITRKPLHKASPRLQIMLLKLLRYKLNVRYVQGSKMYIADTLSRAYITDNNPQSIESELRIHSITERFPVTPAKLQVLKTASREDEHFTHLKRYIAQGWPK